MGGVPFPFSVMWRDGGSKREEEPLKILMRYPIEQSQSCAHLPKSVHVVAKLSEDAASLQFAEILKRALIASREAELEIVIGEFNSHPVSLGAIDDMLDHHRWRPELGAFPYWNALNLGCSIAALRVHRSEEHTSELQSRPHLVC